MPKKPKLEPLRSLIAKIDAVYARTSKRRWQYDPEYEMFIGYRHMVLRPSGNLNFGTVGPRRWDSNGKVLEDDKSDAAEAELTALLHNHWPRISKALRKR